MQRRDFLKAGLCGLSYAAIASRIQAGELPPVRAITTGPKFHWFGYYDKLEFDPTDRYVLSNQVDFEHRTPTADDVIKVGMVDLKNNDKWIELGQSNAWGWQQGCMLQWRPSSESEVFWNDRVGNEFVSHLLDVKTMKRRTIPSAIYTLSPDGRFGITADFARIQFFRPGYGYAGGRTDFMDDPAPKDSGVFYVDLTTGEKKLILSLDQIIQIPFQGEKIKNSWHWFNHLLISPDSKRFIVLHRWRSLDPETGEMTKRWKTRMVTANVDGSDVYILNPTGMTSHFVWRDPEHVCMYTQPEGKPAGFYVYKDRTAEIEHVGAGVMTSDGHNTYLPGRLDWILNDSYPDRVSREQKPFLYHIPTNRRIELGGFYLDPKYVGEWRCDTHPRASRSGKLVAIDSPHGGNGRQVYLIDISAILDS